MRAPNLNGTLKKVVFSHKTTFFTQNNFSKIFSNVNINIQINIIKSKNPIHNV